MRDRGVWNVKGKKDDVIQEVLEDVGWDSAEGLLDGMVGLDSPIMI